MKLMMMSMKTIAIKTMMMSVLNNGVHHNDKDNGRHNSDYDDYDKQRHFKKRLLTITLLIT